MLGLEQEFILRAQGGDVVDARAVLPHVPADGRRLDPGDRNAIRGRWGGAITCDGPEAEIATAPVPVAPGFTRIADAAARAAARELRGLLPETSLEGFSTHVNVEVPSRIAVQVAWLFTRRLAPAAMLALDRATSPGIFVRPRPGRLEVCGEFAEGAQLRAATALIVGAASACVEAIRTQDGIVARMPPVAPFRPVRARERFGWYVSARRAFDAPLYASGRAARLGGDTAQAFLERTWELARTFVPDHADADALVTGALPLPLEEALPADEVAPAHPPGPLGDALRPRRRGPVAIVAHMQTWHVTVLRVEAPQRTFFACIPAADLAAFLGGLDGGRWDARLTAFAAERPRGRRLQHWTQIGAIGLYDEIGDRRALLRPERDLDGDIVDDWAHLSVRRARIVARSEGDTDARPATPAAASVARAATGVLREGAGPTRERTRPGKYPPPFTELPPTEPPVTEPPPGGSGVPPWIWPVIAVLLVTSIGIALVTSGGGAPQTGGSPSPSAQTSPSPLPCDEPLAAIARAVALDCPVTEHTDPTGDGTWYEAAVPADPLPPGADIVSVQASMARMSSAVVQRFFGATDYPCGRAGSRVVACGDRAFRAGRALVVAVRMAGPVPLDGEEFRIFSVLLDGSPPRGGFRGNPGADQDLYLGADTTIELLYSPIGRRPKTWVLGGSNPLAGDSDASVRSTGARAVIDGDTILFFYPGGEFRDAIPRLRVLSQVSDITFGPQRGFASADVAPGRPSDEPSAMFTADAARAPAPKPAITTSPASTASPTSMPESPERFLERLGAAMRAGDERFLLARLHPEVLRRYPEAECRRLHARGDPTRRFVLRSMRAEPWDWTTDGRTTRIANALTLEVDLTSRGETSRTAIHIARVGATFRFFSDCGTPA